MRVGDRKKNAIMIHDPNGEFRCSVKDGLDGNIGNWIWEHERGILERFCEEILSADPAAGN